MKKISFAAFVILFAILACNASKAAPQTIQPSVGTVVAATMQALTANAPATKPDGIQVSFRNVSFMIPKGLADGSTSELVPAADEANSSPWSVAPEYVSFKLTGYAVQGSYFGAIVHVYPAEEYAKVNSWAESSTTRLKAVLANPTGPLTNDNLPTVPFNGAAAQQYAAQAKIITFKDGTGVRMVSQYAQFPGPITKDNSFYHYEGLTKDGKYLLAILFPVSLPLQATSDNPSADGIPFPSNPTDPKASADYYQAITDKLNAANPETFQPSLTLLDVLVQSITINP